MPGPDQQPEPFKIPDWLKELEKPSPDVMREIFKPRPQPEREKEKEPA